MVRKSTTQPRQTLCLDDSLHLITDIFKIFVDVFNLQCWLATIPAPELDENGFRIDTDEVSLAVAELVASMTKLAFNISCIDCSGPRVPELSKLLSGLNDSENVTAFANGVFTSVKDLINGDFLQIASDRAVTDAKHQCPHSELYDPNYVRKDYGSTSAASNNASAVSFSLSIFLVVACLVAVIVTISLITRLIVRRRHGKWIATLPESHVLVLRRQQAMQRETNQFLNTSTASMFRSHSIPLWIRVSVPIVMLCNIGLFLSGQLSLAADVSVSASLAGQTFRDEGLFEFSMADSTIELWRGKSTLLLIGK
jgi:hypothetical protein